MAKDDKRKNPPKPKGKKMSLAEFRHHNWLTDEQKQPRPKPGSSPSR